MTLEQIRTKLADLRNDRSVARIKLEHAAIELHGNPEADNAAVLRQRIDNLRETIAQLSRLETDANAQLSAQLDPRVHVPMLDGEIPILLMPLRVQTRFDLRRKRLLVRVYPDTISVQQHEPRLTAAERMAGEAFWQAEVAGDRETAAEIWRGMVANSRLNRAAWIREATKPGSPDPEQVEQPVRVPAAWTLPERLVFRLFGAANQLLGDEILGLPIPDGLEMSFDITRSALGFERDDDGGLEYPPELRWQVDFDEAIKVGMGISVPLDRIGNVPRIERLVVLGVRLSTDERDSAGLLGQLIQDHQYSAGFAIVPQGTPTNVTHDSDAPPAADADATLAWLRGDGAFPNNGEEFLYEDEPDGLRLAYALGIHPKFIRYVENADESDGRESIAMRRALWSGTLGYFAQQMLTPLLEDNLPPQFPANSPERLILAARFYFTHFVFGRGPLPAFRVGQQPYGVLPVCADMLNQSPPNQRVWGDAFVDAFLLRLHDKMRTLSHTWIKQLANVPRAGAGPNAKARLLDILATQASSVEWHSERLVGREYLREYAGFKEKPLAFDAFALLLLERLGNFKKEFSNLLNGPFPRIFDLTFFGGYWRKSIEAVQGQLNNLKRGASLKLDGDIIDNLPLSETRGIDATYPNYIKWLRTRSFDDVRRGLAPPGPGGDPHPVRALLYLVLRHSYLYEHAFTAMRFHVHFQNAIWSQFIEKELYNLTFEPDTLPWDLVSKPGLNWFFGEPQPRTGSVLDLIRDRTELRPTLGLDWKMLFGDIDELFRALSVLSRLTTARLERLFAEHMDLASYRLDAWLTGYAYNRLLAHRVWGAESQANRLNPLYEAQSDRPPLRFDLNHRPLGRYARGIFLGAYGWAEGIVADPIPDIVNDLPPELDPRNDRPVTRDKDNYGLIHGPSLNHAVTAAILRSASVTQPGVSAYNVDLSSARVREALWIMEGVRNGQTPAALLGYRFERGMREVNVALLQYLPQLRIAFPMPRQPDTDGDPKEAIIARDVVNGLLIVQAQTSGTLAQKLVDAGIPGPDRGPLVTIAEQVADTFDACADLMLAEGVHQSAQGNYASAGGVVTATGQFSHVPAEFDVTTTPRRGTALSHRLLIAFDGTVAAANDASPRARFEPGLNQWLGDIVGDLATLSYGVTYVFSVAGNQKRSTFVVSLAELGLEPIDLLFAVDDRLTDELSRRLDLLVRPRFLALNPDAEAEVMELDPFATGPVGSRPAGEIIQLLLQIRTLLSSASPATLRDFVAPQLLHGRDADQMDGIDETEMMQRVLGVNRNNADRDDNSLWSRFEAALLLFDDLETLSSAELQSALMAAAQFAIPEAVPRLNGPAADQLKRLQEQAGSVRTLMQTRMETAKEKWTPFLAPEKEVLRICREVTEALLGGGFPIMPRLSTVDLVSAAINIGDQANEVPADSVTDWLFSSAAVREDTAKLQRVRVLAEEFDVPLEELKIFQFPVTQKSWIALPEPEGVTFSGDLTSIAIQPTQNFSPDSPTAALVIDEWQDVIPQKTETTGISFHYDAPNAEPPQALLLAVSQRQPNNNLRWTWEELAECVNQALLIGKIRTVGPDELRNTELDTVLPATLMAEAATPSTIATSLLVNVDDKAAVGYHAMWSKT